GDQYQGNDGEEYNYVYKNGYRIGDYIRSGSLYRRLKPDIILTGHWEPQFVEQGYFDIIEERGSALERLHQALLPLDHVNFDAHGFGASITPYQVFASANTPFSL